MTLRNAASIFVVAFLLNAVWENIHSALYIHCQSGPISEYILLRASAVDAAIILLGIFLSEFFIESHRVQFLATFWLLLAIIIEWWALSFDRWSYSAAMPMIPFLETGLTPTIQLGVIGFLSRFLANKMR